MKHLIDEENFCQDQLLNTQNNNSCTARRIMRTKFLPNYDVMPLHNFDQGLRFNTDSYM